MECRHHQEEKIELQNVCLPVRLSPYAKRSNIGLRSISFRKYGIFSTVASTSEDCRDNGPLFSQFSRIKLVSIAIMNVSLAKKIEKITPKHILKPKPKMDTPLPLNNGATIPALGLGTWQSKPGEVQAAVAYAIKAGYRHIDCAYVYGNEKEVGDGLAEGMKSAGVKREELFITTKLWCTYHSRVEENLDESLRRLGLDYVDLYLMHWPVPMNPKGSTIFSN